MHRVSRMRFSPDNISNDERDQLWNRFEHEDGLMSELEYYQEKIKRMPTPNTALDHAVLDTFRSHIGNLERLLRQLYEHCPHSRERGRIT